MSSSPNNRNRINLEALSRLMGVSDRSPSLTGSPFINNRNDRPPSGRWDPNLIAAAVNRAINGNTNVRINMDIDVGYNTRSVVMDTGLRADNRVEMDRDVATDRISVSVPLTLTTSFSMSDLQYLTGMPNEFIEPVMAQMMGTALEALLSNQAPRRASWTMDPDVGNFNPRKTTVEVKADDGPTQVVRYTIDAKASQSIANNSKQFELMAERVLLAAKLAVQKELEAIVLERRDGAAPKPLRRIDLD